MISLHGKMDIIHLDCDFEKVSVDDLPPQTQSFAKKASIKDSVFACIKDYTIFLLRPKGFFHKTFHYIPFVKNYRAVSTKTQDGYAVAIVEQVVPRNGSTRWDNSIIEYTERGTMKIHTLTDAIDKGIAKLVRITDKEIIVELNGKEEHFDKVREYLSLYTSTVWTISAFKNLPDEYGEDYVNFIGEIEREFSDVSKQIHEKMKKIQAKYNIDDDYKLYQAVAKILLKT